MLIQLSGHSYVSPPAVTEVKLFEQSLDRCAYLLFTDGSLKEQQSETGFGGWRDELPLFDGVSSCEV